MSCLRNVGAIWLRELGSYFLSPIAYVVIFLFLLTNGTMFSFYSFQFTGHPRQIPMVIESLFGFALIWIIPISPLLTMKLFAEEKRTGTLEVLMTAPVTESQVVAGKFLAAQTLYSFVWLSLLPLMAMLWAMARGAPDPGPVIAIYVGIFSLGLLTNSLGLLASAATRNQLVAAVLALSGNLALFLASLARFLAPEDFLWRRFVRYISFTTHFDSEFGRGVVDLRSVLFYAVGALFLLLCTTRLVEARKWR